MSPGPLLLAIVIATFLIAEMMSRRRIRTLLPEARFRQVFQVAILLLGISVMASGGA